MPRPIEDVLRENPFYRRLPAAERASLAEVTRARSFPKGSIIFREGDPAEQFISIAEGRVKIFKTTPSGKDIILQIFTDGDPIGVVAVYEDTSFPASAEAMEDTTCLCIGKRDFFALLESHPLLVRGLLLSLTQRLIELTRRMSDLTGGRVEVRFARLFLKLAAKLGQVDADGIAIPMHLSRQELADLAGTTIETCIRVMSRWGKTGILRTEKEGFTILDRNALEALASS
jgi:CRP/FNR family transcriptional regulator